MQTLELLKKELVVTALQLKLGKEVSLRLPICYMYRCMHLSLFVTVQKEQGGEGGGRRQSCVEIFHFTETI